MANTTEVTAGDLITAALMNEILQRIAALEGNATAPTGNIIVPNLFGLKLPQAMGILKAPSSQVSMGEVIDADGLIVDTIATASKKRIVIGQSPEAGQLVPQAKAVNLLVNSEGSSASQPPKKIVVSAAVPNTAAIGEEVVIQGSGFDPNPQENVVTFNGIETLTPPSNQSSAFNLFVKVPKGVEEAPTKPGQPTLKDVTVVVKTPNGEGTTKFNISAPSDQPEPQIAKITPKSAIIDDPVVITGSNFSETLKNNIVTFKGVTGKITKASADSLTVIVPEIAGADTPGVPVKNVPVIVTVKDIGPSNTELIDVTRKLVVDE